MKNHVPKFQKAVAAARQQLLAAETAFAKLDSLAKNAKAKSRQLKLDHKRARLAAKAAKKAASAAQDKVQQKAKAVAKASRHLEKALKKLGKKAPRTPANARPKVKRAAVPRSKARLARPVTQPVSVRPKTPPQPAPGAPPDSQTGL